MNLDAVYYVVVRFYKETNQSLAIGLHFGVGMDNGLEQRNSYNSTAFTVWFDIMSRSRNISGIRHFYTSYKTIPVIEREKENSFYKGGGRI